jgi:hypothetical protein
MGDAGKMISPLFDEDDEDDITKDYIENYMKVSYTHVDVIKPSWGQKIRIYKAINNNNDFC